MLNCQDKHKNSALASAAITGQLQTVKFLCSTRDALHVDIPDEDACTPLMLALGAGHEEVARLLLQCGASRKKSDVNGWTVMHHAAAGGLVEVMKELHDDGLEMDALAGAGQSCLFMAAYGGHFAAVDFLLHKGLDPRLSELVEEGCYEVDGGKR